MRNVQKTIHYWVHRNPDQKLFHVRVAKNEVVNIRQMLDEERNEQRAKIAEEGWLILLDAITEALRSGKTVHLDGLGTLSLVLKGKINYKEKWVGKKNFLIDNIGVKRVAFRTSAKLKKEIQKNATFVADAIPQVEYIDEENYVPQITEYFARDPDNQLTRSTLRKLTNLTDIRSRKLLEMLVKQGKLRRVGDGHNARYVPTPGNFGR